jgi:hypothetical protein
MTRKDYEKFAREIRAHVTEAARGPNPDAYSFEECKAAAMIAAAVFVEDNPRFDRMRFLTAAGVE